MSSAEKFKELAFDVVLPAHLLVNKNLEPNAKLLYGFIRNLTRLEGYCFATNKYLAELMDCSITSIKDWLRHLGEQGYIEVEHETEVFNAQRRIFITDGFKKSLQRPEIRPGVAEKSTGGWPEIRPHKEDIDKEDIRKKNKKPAAPAQALEMARFLFEALKRRYPKAKEPKFESWARELDLTNRMDGRAWDEIRSLILWAEKDAFWYRSLLSPSAIRRNWDKMSIQINDSNSRKPASQSKGDSWSEKDKRPAPPPVDMKELLSRGLDSSQKK